MENNEPKDKYALVTGAAKGIGKASALELAKLGSNVVINYNSSHEEAEKTVHEIKKLGVKSMSVQADVGNLDQVNFMIKKINDELGQINILVNNAGIAHIGTAETTRETKCSRLSLLARPLRPLAWAGGQN